MLIYVKLLLTAFFWGGTFIAGRTLAGHVAPFSAAFLRFLIASACLFGLTRHIEGKIPLVAGSRMVSVILLGITGVFAYNFFFFKGLQYIEAGRASLIIANNPAFIAIFSALLFKEKLTALKIIGIVVSLAGAIVVISWGNFSALLSSGMGRGEILIFGCVASWVAFSLIGKTVMGALSPLAAIFWSSLVGTVALFFPACLEGLLTDWPHYRSTDWLSLCYLGIFGTVLGFVWYYEGIRAIGPTKAALFINFVPVSAILLAWIILAEPVTLSLLIGAVLVSLGIYLTNSVKTVKVV